ncbi:MAG: glycosyltransferase family 2 protein [Alphaproteobacteria bacterium]|nr:glycosyltransferase family 2 protein [Alphaproteobacteria bacterium]
MSNCKISVIVPVFNEAKVLPRCMDSLLKQTLRDMEVICINDGSTDNSLNILQNYATRDARFKIISQENQGLSISRNKGINMAHGEYIFFLDSDDYLHPQALEIFYQTAVKSGAPVVVSKNYCKLGKDVVSSALMNIDNIRYKICKTPLSGLYRHRLISAVAWNKLYKKEALQDFRFIEGIYFEDWPFTACLFSNIKNFALINEKVYVYNTSSPSITRSKFTIRKIHDYIVGIRYVYNYFMRLNKAKEWEIVRKNRINTSIKMMLSKISKSTDNIDELERYFKQEYVKLANEHLVYFGDLSLKSKFRLIRLFWHQRHQ